MKTRHSKKRSTSRRPAVASSLLSMVDLLSCAFGGALFLFLITAAPSPGSKAAVPAINQMAIATLLIDSDFVRPILVVREKRDDGQWGRSFVIDQRHIEKGQGWRKVTGAGASVSDTGGKVLINGNTTPWDAKPGERLPELSLFLERPNKSQWCFTVALADDDSRMTKRQGTRVYSTLTRISVQKAGASQMEHHQIDLPLNASTITQCEKCCFWFQ